MVKRLVLLLLAGLLVAGVSFAQASLTTVNNTEYQFELQYPSDWTDFAFNDQLQAFVTSTKDFTRGYYVTPLKNPDEATPEGIMNQLMTLLGAESSEPTPVQVSGVDGVEFTYTYTDPDLGEFKGRGFAVYFDTLKTGLLFSAEVTADVSDDEHEQLYDTLKSGVVFTSMQTPGVPGGSIPANGGDATEGVYWQTATAGSLTLIAGDTYTLTLNDVPEQTEWSTVAPQFNAGTYATAELALYWNEAEPEIGAKAILDTGTAIVDLELSKPVYDAETKTLTYTAVLVGSAPKADDGPQFSVADPLPASTLIIQTRQDFEDALVATFLAKADNSRGRANCPNKTRPKPKC